MQRIILRDKGQILLFPDDMEDSEIERVIRTEIYGEDLAPEPKEQMFGDFREKEFTQPAPKEPLYTPMRDLGVESRKPPGEKVPEPEVEVEKKPQIFPLRDLGVEARAEQGEEQKKPRELKPGPIVPPLRDLGAPMKELLAPEQQYGVSGSFARPQEEAVPVEKEGPIEPTEITRALEESKPFQRTIIADVAKGINATAENFVEVWKGLTPYERSQAVSDAVSQNSSGKLDEDQQQEISLFFIRKLNRLDPPQQKEGVRMVGPGGEVSSEMPTREKAEPKIDTKLRSVLEGWMREGMTVQEIRQAMAERDTLLRYGSLFTPGGHLVWSGEVEDPWLDIGMAGSAGFGGGVTVGKKAGEKILTRIARGVAGGGLAISTEYPIGATLDLLAKEHPALSAPLAITVGLLAGMKIEAPVEDKIIKALKRISKSTEWTTLPPRTQSVVAMNILDKLKARLFQDPNLNERDALRTARLALPEGRGRRQVARELPSGPPIEVGPTQRDIKPPTVTPQPRVSGDAEAFPGMPSKKQLPIEKGEDLPATMPPHDLKGARYRDMIKTLEDAFDVPVFVGGIHPASKASGLYFKKAKAIRLKKLHDLETRIHEYGHYFQDLLGLPKSMPKEVQDMAYTGAKDLDREGFAEFIRMFTLHPTEAQEMAPNFFKEFTEVLAKNTRVQDVLVQIREANKVFKAADPVSRVMSLIAYGSEVDKKGLPGLNTIYAHVKDHFHAINRLQKAVRGNTEWNPDTDPYLLARGTKGWVRKAETFLKHYTFQMDRQTGIRKTGKSFRDIVNPIWEAGRIKELDAYLLAKRAEFDWRISEGFRDRLVEGDIKKTVEKYEDEFGEVAKELYRYQDQLLDYVVSTGRISQETANSIRNRNSFYAPLYRVMGEDGHLRGGSSNKSFDKIMSPVKELKGSDRDVLSPIENIMYNTYMLINIAERQRVANALRALSKVPGAGKILHKRPGRILPVQITEMEGVRGLLKSFEQIGGDVAAQFADNMGMIKEHQKVVKDIAKKSASKEWMDEHGIEGIENILAENNMKWDDLWELSGMITAFRTNYTPRSDEILLYRNGKPELYSIADPELAKSLKSIDAEAVHAMTRVFALPAKTLRAGATTLSPEFGARNLFRDQWTAWIQSKYGYLPFVDFVKGLAHMLGETDTYMRYNASGGAHAALVSMDRRYLSKNVKELMEQGSIVGFAKNPLQALQALSEFSEEATRVGYFAKAERKIKRKGLDAYQAMLKAGFESREVTLDFSRQGDSFFRSMNMISAFWNARFEGLDKMVRTFKDRPVATSAKVFSGVTLPSVLLWYAQKDDPYYQELPPWRRNLFWNYVIHNEDGTLKRIVSIPKPFEYGIIFGSMVEAFLEWGYNNDPDFARKVGHSLEQTLNLVPIPTFAVPPTEHLTNFSYFYERPLVPTSLREGSTAVADVEQYTGTTSEVSKFVSRLIAKVPGFDGIAPAMLDNYVRGYTGAFGRLGLEQGDFLLEKFGLVEIPPQPKKGLEDIPGLRAFLTKFPNVGSRSIDQVYKEYEERMVKWNTNKKPLRGWGVEIPKPPRLEELQTAVNALRMQRKVLDLVYRDEKMTPAEKETVRDSILLGMINTARATLDKKQINEKAKMREAARIRQRHNQRLR